MARILIAALLLAAGCDAAVPAPIDADVDGAPRDASPADASADTSVTAAEASPTRSEALAAWSPEPSSHEPEETPVARVEQHYDPFDSISVLATLRRTEWPERRRTLPRSLRSSATLREPLRHARRAARDSSGVDYRWAAFRLGSGDNETQLRAAAETYLRPDPLDFVYYADVDAREVASPEAFDVELAQTPAERAALERLVEALDALSREQGLLPYRVHAGWADAVGGAYHGIALVNPRTRDALWVFAEATWSA